MGAIRKYDIVVVGTGPAGETAAIQASKLGKKTLIVEKTDRLGGNCLHTGTIPSKSLRETVVHWDLLRKRTHGIEVSLKKNVTVPELMHRKQVVVHDRVDRFIQNLRKNRIDLEMGSPHLLNPKSVEIVSAQDQSTSTVEAQFVVIATGSRPYRPDWVDFDDETIFDSDSILTMDHLPGKLTVIGAGVLGCEYASIFAHMGIRVNLIAKDSEVLPFLDREIAESLTYRIRRSRITIRLDEAVESIRKIDKDKVNVNLKSGKVLPCGMVLVATGRSSNSEGLGLESLGVELAERGRILVNANYQTGVENIYAVGDVIGFPGLASTAMLQARTAVLHAFGMLDASQMPTDLPFGIWTIPPVAMVGKTEEQLTESATPYEIGIARIEEVARANIMGESYDGMLKLLFDPESHRLLGVHIMGPRAPELIHLGQAVLFHQGTIDYFTNAVFNYPTLDEAYRIAAFNGLNRLSFNS